MKAPMLSPVRRFLKSFHPEGIPWPGTAFYNVMSQTRIFQHSYERLARDILSFCSEGSILDVGTGPGWLLVRLHQESTKLKLTGLDASPSMVAKAEKNVTKAGLSHLIDVKEGNVDSMPFAADSFDAVVSSGSLHHWKDPTAGLNEIHRVLRKGGYALIYDLVSDTPSSVLKEGAREFGRLKMFLCWLHAFEEPFYSAKDTQSLARPTLFKEGRIRFVGITCCLIMRKGLPLPDI